MKKDSDANFWLISAIIVIIFVVGIFYLVKHRQPAGPGPYDQFAQCLTDSGAKLFGAFWCPHCRDQKKLFGDSITKAPYVECSTADGKSQLQICNDENITAYPTWKFADGSVVTGLLSLEQLSEKTSCPLDKTNTN